MKLIASTNGLTNHLLKIVSFIFGYFFWLILVQTQKINITMKAPLCFYNLKENLEIETNENINITIYGTRNDLYLLNNYDNCAIHINASNFEVGVNKINLKNEDIFLHHKIKLLDFNPSTVTIQIKEKK